MKIPDLREIYQAYMYSYPHKTKYGPLENINVFDYLTSCDLGKIDFYFHIPFCASKCGYCNLFSIVDKDGELLDNYLAAMESQIKQYGLSGITPQSFTIGGGTPLILPAQELERLFTMFPSMNKAQSSIETSPNETTEDKLKILKMYDIDRVSIGIQSFNDGELKNLGRTHRAFSARKALALIKKHAFPILNIDLMYRIPGQTLSSLKDSVEEALDFSPDEIFLYPLYIRKGTTMYTTFGKEYINPDIYKMYIKGRDRIVNSGYTQISMRRFVKKPPYNPPSCGLNTVLSIGCGGRSYVGNLHFCHPFTMDNGERCKTINAYIHADKTRVTNGYILNNEEHKRRFVIKNLLHVYGLLLADYWNSFQSNVYNDFPLFNELSEKGYIQAAEEKIQLTELGLSLSDYIGPLLGGYT